METVELEKLDVHRDERGWVSEIYSGIEDVEIRNIHLGTMESNVVRGNHVHQQTSEWISFLNGPVQIRWREETGKNERLLEKPTRIYLPPGIPHAFRNPGDSVVNFAAYTDRRYREENPDVRTVKLFEENR